MSYSEISSNGHKKVYSLPDLSQMPVTQAVDGLGTVRYNLVPAHMMPADAAQRGIYPEGFRPQSAVFMRNGNGELARDERGQPVYTPLKKMDSFFYVAVVRPARPQTRDRLLLRVTVDGRQYVAGNVIVGFNPEELKAYERFGYFVPREDFERGDVSMPSRYLILPHGSREGGVSIEAVSWHEWEAADWSVMEMPELRLPVQRYYRDPVSPDTNGHTDQNEISKKQRKATQRRKRNGLSPRELQFA